MDCLTVCLVGGLNKSTISFIQENGHSDLRDSWRSITLETNKFKISFEKKVVGFLSSEASIRESSVREINVFSVLWLDSKLFWFGFFSPPL